MDTSEPVQNAEATKTIGTRRRPGPKRARRLYVKVNIMD